jgi:hypothetical protein
LAGCGAVSQEGADRTFANSGGAGGGSALGGGGTTSDGGAGGEGGDYVDTITGAGGASSTQSGSGGAMGCDKGTVHTDCNVDADCDDGDPTTTDTCHVSGGEFPTRTCLHDACEGPDCALDPIDTACTDGDNDVVYPPAVPLTPPTVPADCHNGFQTSNRKGSPPIVLQSLTPAGSRAMTLDLDFATYTAPDGIQITGIDGECKTYTLFETCRLKTADKPYSAYTSEDQPRPDDIAIRQFHLTLRPGTTQLTFDFTRVGTPMYIQILGLCDFAIPTPDPNAKPWVELVP